MYSEPFESGQKAQSVNVVMLNFSHILTFPFCYRVKKVCFKTLVDEVQELEALSKDPGAVVHGKRYSYTSQHLYLCFGVLD